MIMYYLGPEGTHSHEAATVFSEMLGGDVTLSACPTISDAVVKVASPQSGRALACVPMENSIQGSVTQMWDTLMEIVSSRTGTEAGQFGIQLALTQPIHHYVLHRSNLDFALVDTVYSHPQALAQCRLNIQKRFPGAKQVAVSSTAEAARIVGTSEAHAVAIASLRAGEKFGLDSDEVPFEDKSGNVTRFGLVSGPLSTVRREIVALSDTTRIVSLCLHGISHSPGGLVGALAPFAELGLNLERVESRPVGDQLGHYVFYVDISVNETDGAKDPVAQVVERLASKRIDVVTLGSYQVIKGK